MSKGNLFVITAPSGAGKTTLVNALIHHDGDLVISVSHTTRPARPGEENGINYHFVNDEEFTDMLRAGEFLESAGVYGYHYGTSKRWVNRKLAAGFDVILELDWQGAAQIRKLEPDACFIFILPPSLESLALRLRERGQDDQETIDGRMRQAQSVIEHVTEADFIVVNDDFETALGDIRAILHSRRLTVASQKKNLAGLLANLARC